MKSAERTFHLSQPVLFANREVCTSLLRRAHILFMSATPIKNNIFGNTIYELSWSDAIKNKYICDYNFYYPNNDRLIEHIDNLKIDKSLVSKTIYINKAYFLLESIKITNVRKCIVYLKTIQEADEFSKILKVINIYFDLPLKTYEINCNTSAKNRKQYMNKFAIDNNSINIICNVHILDEGIDIPVCDSIYLTHPNNNVINIIQRISRANRLDANNMDKVAKVFIWSKNDDNIKNIFNNISKVINIKYGNEKNDFINNNVKINNNEINNNENNDKTIIINKYYDGIKKYVYDDMIKNILLNNVIIDVDNNIWFESKKILKAIGYKDTKDVLRCHVSKDNRTYAYNIIHNTSIKVHPSTIYINNISLYIIVLKSKLERAKLLIDWVNHNIKT